MPPDDVIFEDIIRPTCPRTVTQIQVGGVRQVYAPCIRSMTANFCPGTHTTELDYDNLLLMYQICHHLFMDVPRMMTGFVAEECHGTHAFPFPGIITRAITQAGVSIDSF